MLSPFRLALTGLLMLISVASFGQSTLPGFFLDCQTWCHRTYVRQEIQFVNHILNRQEAEIYVLATDQETGAGGDQVQLIFIGQYQYEGMTDTLSFYVDPNATEAIRRDQMVRTLKQGLLPFLLQSSLADQIEFEVTGNEGEEAESNQLINDPWNFWVFNVGGNAFLDGEARYRSADLSARASASRITDQHKFWVSGFYNYQTSRFFLSDGEEVSTLIRRYRSRALYVRSLGPRWSAGISGFAGSSTFGNTDLEASVKPAIEFNVFPYTEAQTRRLSFLYEIGPEYYNYTDTTVFGQLEETRMRHGINLNFSQTQKWGGVSVSFGAQQFLHQPSLFSTYMNPEVEWQIFRGMSLDLGGYVSYVRDRINVAKDDISDEDILLQIKQLDTSFTYFTYIGVNYRFGSRYNNFINPRFDRD